MNGNRLRHIKQEENDGEIIEGELDSACVKIEVAEVNEDPDSDPEYDFGHPPPLHARPSQENSGNVHNNEEGFIYEPPPLLYVGPSNRISPECDPLAESSDSDVSEEDNEETEEDESAEEEPTYMRTEPGYIDSALPGVNDETGEMEDEVALELREESLTLDMLNNAASLDPKRRKQLELNEWVGNPVDDPLGGPKRKSKKDDDDYSTETEDSSSAESLSDDDYELPPPRRRRCRRKLSASPEDLDTPIEIIFASSSTAQRKSRRKRSNLQLTVKPTEFDPEQAIACLSCPDPGNIPENPVGNLLKSGRLHCLICGVQFYCLYHLNIHKTVHSYKFKCKECGTRFPLAHNADIHYRFRHCPIADRSKCFMCGMKCVRLSYDHHFNVCYRKQMNKKNPRLAFITL